MVIYRKVLLASLVCLVAAAAAIWALDGSGKVHYLPYYLPCPETFSTKLQYTEEKPIQLFPQLFYLQPRALAPKRQDVLTVTPWLVPIIWEGTFDAEILDSACRPLNLTMGVAAFAVGKQGQHPKAAARPSLSLLCPTGCVCSAWQQESHPNRHFVSHRPSKLLSPEQIWGDRKPKPQIHLVCFYVNKNYKEVRN
ncbi:LOW QUALITY PROTEIN: globoside alpha-1,3-N-acetylgalactosaminyltransferase 1 [Passerculus sandwichensis]